MTVSESLDISHCYSYNENYTCGASTDWMWVGDTLILYPQTEGTQLLLEKIAYNNNSSNRYRIYVYDGVGTDGNLLMTVEDNTPTAPAMSTTGALTLVPNRGRCTIQNELLLRVSELDCMPPVYGFACTDQTFATAEFAWNMLNPEEYADFNFNWRVEYGPHGFTPGTGTMVPSNTTSLSIGGLTVRAKTGTAEVGNNKQPNAWFVGYATDADCPLAFACVVQDSGMGGEYAIPVIEATLSTAAERLRGSMN